MQQSVNFVAPKRFAWSWYWQRWGWMYTWRHDASLYVHIGPLHFYYYPKKRY